jgi:dihydroorotase-like cyclic amidohydrolase
MNRLIPNCFNQHSLFNIQNKVCQFLSKAEESLQPIQTIDATGMLVFPGGIDPHVHLDMPFMGTFSSDSYETGTRAALFGGTTTWSLILFCKSKELLYSCFR